MENKFNVSAVSGEWKQYVDLLKLFSGAHNYFQENKEFKSRRSRSSRKTKSSNSSSSSKSGKKVWKSLENLSRSQLLTKNNKSASMF